jgi:hypothetical protein
MLIKETIIVFRLKALIAENIRRAGTVLISNFGNTAKLKMLRVGLEKYVRTTLVCSSIFSYPLSAV